MENTNKSTIEDIKKYMQKGNFEKGISQLVQLYNEDPDNREIIQLAQKYGIRKRVESGKAVRDIKFKSKKEENER